MKRSIGPPPKCFICDQKHWALDDCPEVENVIEEPVSPPQHMEPDVVRAEQSVHEEEGGSDGKEGTKTQVEHNRAWRAKNPEKYRDYMREYMRKKRG